MNDILFVELGLNIIKREVAQARKINLPRVQSRLHWQRRNCEQTFLARVYTDLGEHAFVTAVFKGEALVALEFCEGFRIDDEQPATPSPSVVSVVPRDPTGTKVIWEVYI